LQIPDSLRNSVRSEVYFKAGLEAGLSEPAFCFPARVAGQNRMADFLIKAIFKSVEGLLLP
jgi:hypothetical protein